MGRYANRGNCDYGRTRALPPTDCFNARSEGVTLRSVGDGTVVDHNIISDVQSGITPPQSVRRRLPRF